MADAMKEHEQFMRIAIQAADDAVANGNHPFGAVLVRGGEILMIVENTVITEQDNTRHAELSLVSQAERQFSRDVLQESTLYASTEPCVMCAGAIYWSGIRRVVYGCPAGTVAAYAGTDFVLPTRDVYARSQHSPQVIGPVLETEATEAHKTFWQG